MSVLLTVAQAAIVDRLDSFSLFLWNNSIRYRIDESAFRKMEVSEHSNEENDVDAKHSGTRCHGPYARLILYLEAAIISEAEHYDNQSRTTCL